ncbi:transformation/transcription domain-associated protein [Tetranychus urticae]|uniref:transformation/transcription domain-associated protein n=1 Tax=Tetranychus urticae TaxID=32264 RepID=UPI00077BB01A|nr:transformation/transcription domain-associated protein [Tetranychus urticae]
MASDVLNKVNACKSYVSLLVDPNARDDSKLKAAQAIAEDLEAIISSPQYPSFLEHAVNTFRRFLADGQPLFIVEHTGQQLRKLILEIIQRLPVNEHLRVHSNTLISLMFLLLDIENEENVLVILRIIIELHKSHRPPFSTEIQKFLNFVKKIYQDLPNNMNRIFEIKQSLKVKDISELTTQLPVLINEIFTLTPVMSEKKSSENNLIYNLIPKATLSLKVLAELPIIVVLMYQLYKANLQQEIEILIPLIMNALTLQPSPQLRNHAMFNQEVFVDFVAAQIKTLSFLAYMVRIYQDSVNANVNQLITGFISILVNCPHEVAHLRKELLIAARHILMTDLKTKFIPCIDQLFDENIVIGKGWTAQNSLRPLAYSTIADLVHHVRTQLKFKDLVSAVNVFSKNVHDEHLTNSIHTMSCKLLLNLVECIRTRAEIEHGAQACQVSREVLLKLLEVYVLKFKHIAKHHIPMLINRQTTQQASHSSNSSQQTQQHSTQSLPQSTNSETKSDESKPFPSGVGENFGADDRPKFGFPTIPSDNYSISDCKGLVKTLIVGVKTITYGMPSYRAAGDTSTTPPQQKQFHPKETILYIRLVKYALMALDVYTITPSPVNISASLTTSTHQNVVQGTTGIFRANLMSNVRPKEEKEVLEHFAGVFQNVSPQSFREVFSTLIDFYVERTNSNIALLTLANSFLGNPVLSPVFATIIVEYLLERMEEMGTNLEKSNLHLKLYKLVFGSVSLFPAENELMLKPHLHNIVNRSLELALSAKEPYNYFLLLRALFRSIGGGSHDLLYQEFLPLLPSLLQGLNSLQSGLHKQHMHDLFVELCLTVPVRLSSLLPYLPMLMDPLVAALNGSQTLVSQGLRTLELCVDNLQPDFLYDHIQPVRAGLMQALWKTLRYPSDSIAGVSFRLLGKFGGGNRKMMTEPQKIEFIDHKEGSVNGSTSIVVCFPEHKSSINLPIDKVIETAFNALKSSTTDPFYRRQCWEVIKGFLIAHIQPPPPDEDKYNLQRFFSHPSFSQGEIHPLNGPFYKSSDSQIRKVHEMALTGMFVAAAIKELRSIVLPFMVSLVRHYTLLAISQQSGPINLGGKQHKLYGMDALVLIDAVATIMGHEEKELCKPGHLALIIILDTGTAILGSRERTCQLPLTEYLVERMCALCYDRAWYAKLGGCIAIKFLFERMTLKWVFAHQYMFLKALLFVMMDLTGEVSSGAVDMAKSNLEKMITLCAAPIKLLMDGSNSDLVEAQKKSLHEVTQELVRQVTSPNTCVRQQAMNSLKVLAEVQESTIEAIMRPHKDVLTDMVPPKKNVLGHQPVNTQIGLMEGNTFCMTLEPPLFTLDMSVPEHVSFVEELTNLCKTEDAQLMKFAIYKNVPNLTQLKKSVLKTLTAYAPLYPKRDEIFPVLFCALLSTNSEIQETGFECLKKFLTFGKVDLDAVINGIRSYMADHEKLNLNIIKRINYLAQLFPVLFTEKLCDRMAQNLKKWLDTVVRSHKKNIEEMKVCAALIDFFHIVPATGTKYVEVLLCYVFKTEKALSIEPGSILRDPLRKFLQRYPEHTLDLLLTERNINEDQIYRFVKYLLKGPEGAIFRQVLQQNPARLVKFASGPIQIQEKISIPQPQAAQPDGSGAAAPQPQAQTQTVTVTYDLQYQAILITSILVKYDEQWLSGQIPLVEALIKIWNSPELPKKHSKIESSDYVQWREPKLLMKCLLNYFKQNPNGNSIILLFNLLRAFINRYICDFDFFRDFLEQTVTNYTIEWKREAFFKFANIFYDDNYPQELKAKILQYIIIPSFAVTFERGEGERLIGGPPAPEQDQDDNLISVFIYRVVEPEYRLYSDAVRILLLQFSCLLVEQASPHIHDAANKRQGTKLRRLMTFAWPCLLSKSCVDPATKYHGHLLLAHIIAKFAIHKRIVLQVFHSLLKAHANEARTVVRQALEILTPAMPQRMEDGNSMLTHWTKKIIVEEGHSLPQLTHMLQLLIRHYKVYYPVRHHLIQHMVASIQRLGFTPNSTVDHRKISVDLVEVILLWELQRSREEQEQQSTAAATPTATASTATATTPLTANVPGTSSESVAQPSQKIKIPSTPTPSSSYGKPLSTDNNDPVEKTHQDAIVNFLLRLACHVNETGTNLGSPGEILSRRCVNLLKLALKPEIWPTAELRLGWFDKLLLTVESTTPNYGNICTALELLSFLLNILRREAILVSFKPLQRGIAACMTCTNTKVIRCVHNLLTRLMSFFPTEGATSTTASKHEELEALYSAVSKVIFEGLSNYEKATGPTLPQSLFGTIMILKAACSNNPCYIDRMIVLFMRVLQKMAREHLSPTLPNEQPNPMGSELLILSLDLVKNRIGVMGQEMRKAFFTNILVGLIEKSPDVKVLRAITKMLEDWVKNKGPFGANQAPTLREKTLLLVKMMMFVEKRFADDNELMAQFLELINYVYRDESLKNTDLATKLEQAFMSGLRCVQPQIRAKFFEVFDASIRRRLHDRLLYIVCSQNWETIGPHFWIKQCIELILVSVIHTLCITSGNPIAMLPSPTAVIDFGDQQERASLANSINDQMDIDMFCAMANGIDSVREAEEVMDIELSSAEENQSNNSRGSIYGGSNLLGTRRPSTPSDPTQHLRVLISKQNKFLNSLKETRTLNFLMAVAQLCHMDTNLAYHTWIQLFPRLWKILSERQQNLLTAELIPFICSGSHIIQKDCHPSAIGCFMEAIAQCSPVIPIRPSLLKYMGKSHNIWHRVALMLENIAFDKSIAGALTTNTTSTTTKYTRKHDGGDTDYTEPAPVPSMSLTQEANDSLAEIYETLKEEDLWAGLWQKRAKYQETLIGIAYEQQGFFEQAQGAFELAMTKARNDYNTNPAPLSLQGEYRLWEKHWIRCSKELNQWDLILDYGNSKGCTNPFLVLESAWRIPQWMMMKKALHQVETNHPKELAWKVALFKGYNHICNVEDHNLPMADRMVDLASTLCIKEWRRLPSIVSHIHVDLLQAAQLIMELQEAGQINQSLTPNNTRASCIHDMKAIVKTWKNRLPVLSDDFSHWSHVFTWRQHHFQAIVQFYDPTNTALTNLGTRTAVAEGLTANITNQPTDPQASQAVLGVHASAQSIINTGRIARKHGLIGACLEALTKIHAIPSIPIVDCFQKIRQQVKCYLQLASTGGKNELQEGLEIIESTNLNYFTREMKAEFYGLKGLFLSQLGRSEEANRAFSAGAQLHDGLNRAWALWGEYLETLFTREKWESRQMSIGVSAITCYLHACRSQNETKARKYLAKVIWLLTYDDDSLCLADAVEKYSHGVPPVCWLPWIPQLLTCLIKKEGDLAVNILIQVGRMFPQAVYFPVRTLFLTLRMEQREKQRSSEIAAGQNANALKGKQIVVNQQIQGTTQTVTQQQQQTFSNAQFQQKVAGRTTTEVNPIRATASIRRCSMIMRKQQDLHPTVLSSLEGMVDQMVWFRENWYEEILRQLRQGLNKCYAIAFENRAAVDEATVTPHTLNFVNKLVATFGVGVENISTLPSNFATAASESLAKRAQATAQDPVFQKMKSQFSTDFDFSTPGAMKLHNLIVKLKKWIKILEAKTKLLPKTCLMEEKCRFLSYFSQQTADVELPGEFLIPKHNLYSVRIARFMPRVEIVNKHNTAARRFHIRGHNGKIYPYLIVNDSCLSDARREERVLQLFRLLNNYLGKQKETLKRFLHFTVPRVVAISPQTRLVEDNPNSISLLDIYKQRCVQRDLEYDAPISRYYERLSAIQSRGTQASHQVLREILKEIQTNMVPSNLLKDWAILTYPGATDLWTFRKQFTLQMALANVAEYVLCLSRLNPDMMYIHQDTGLMNVAYFRFDVDDVTGDIDANRPVPFRLTHNISELITSIGVAGPLTASMIAISRCLVQPNFKIQSLLRVILRDEVLAWYKKTQEDVLLNGEVTMDGESLITVVNRSIQSIMNRLSSLATFDGAESKVITLVAAANSHDNLCRMDPAWHPWL